MLQRATRPGGRFWVDWWLTNHCTWSCSYCPELLRNGSLAQPNLRDCVRTLNEIEAHAQRQGLRAYVKFTGGEVTEWAGIELLLEQANKLGIDLAIRTNAHAEHGLWARLVEHLTDLEAVYHPEHAQVSTYLLNISRAVDQGVNVRAVFNMLPQRFAETERLIETVRNKYPQVSIDRRMLFEDPGKNTRPVEYPEEQRVVLVRQHGDLERTDDQGNVTYTDYAELAMQGNNGYQGWQCAAGLEQLIIDAWGQVYRGHCRQGGSLGNISGEIKWPADTYQCRRPDCANAFDILATKSLS